MSVKKATIQELIPDDANFNRGNEFGESLIEKSFQKFGAGRSILLDKNNKVIAGNKSLQKYVETGGNGVLVIETDGTEIVAVKRTDVDLNTKKGREMALADNASAKANIEWDVDTLTEWEMPVAEWGIDLPEIETIGEPADAEPQLDKAAELNKKWNVQPGNLWQIGEHRLLCGDSTKREDGERLMDGQKAELLFTSPPYSDQREYGGASDLTVSHLAQFIAVFSSCCSYQVINLGIKRAKTVR